MYLQIISLAIPTVAVIISVIAMRRQSLQTAAELEQNIREQFRQDNIEMKYEGISFIFDISDISVEYDDGTRGMIRKYLFQEKSAETKIFVSVSSNTGNIISDDDLDNKTAIRREWYQKQPDDIKVTATLSGTYQKQLDDIKVTATWSDTGFIFCIETAKPEQVYDATLYFIAGVEQELPRAFRNYKKMIKRAASGILPQE